MTHERFSESDAWELENPDDDLRGRKVVGDDGRAVGRVEDMLVDTATQSIDAVLLDDGREIPAVSLDISGRDLRLVDDLASGMARTSNGGIDAPDYLGDDRIGRSDGLAAPDRDLGEADRMRGTELEDELRGR